MNGTENRHLSPELIEDAALGRLSPEQRVEVDAHLAVCARCREALAQERQIAAGTRSWARASMKRRLATRIAAEPQRRIPWPHVLGAAALVVVIIGVGILFRWLEPASERTLTFSDSTDSAQKMTAPPPPLGRAPEATPPARQAETTVMHDEADALRREKKETRGTDLETMPVSPASESSKDKEAPSIQAVLPEAEELSATGTGTNETWVGGEQVTNAFPAYKQSQPAGASNQGVSMNRLEARKGAYAQPTPAPVFIITQRPGHPDANARGDIHARATPTRLARSGDTIYVTLFLDSLLTPEEMRSVFGRQVSADSFRVYLPDRVLGYRIPAGRAR